MRYFEYFQDSCRLVLSRLNGQQINYQKNGFGDLSCSFLTQLLGLSHQQKKGWLVIAGKNAANLDQC